MNTHHVVGSFPEAIKTHWLEVYDTIMLQIIHVAPRSAMTCKRPAIIYLLLKNKCTAAGWPPERHLAKYLRC